MENAATKQALDFINYTGDHLFLTGKAGTGKTTFLKELSTKTHKSFIVVAPTGVAALNAGGVTIHSQFLFPFGSFFPDSRASVPDNLPHFDARRLARKHPLNKSRKQVLKHIDLLVIDEVSMVRADLLDAIDYRLRKVRSSDLPFGGVQLLMIGDLFQLSPVVKDLEWQYLRDYYPGPQFFNALSLKNSGFHTIELSKVYRQEDQEFVDFLNRVRLHELKAEDLHFINRYHREPAENQEIVQLVTHRRQADTINEEALTALAGKSMVYSAKIDKEFPFSMYPVIERLELKVGAKVMFIKNDWDGERFYNGKMATVENLKKDELYLVMEDGESIEVPLYTWENTRYKLNAENEEMEEEVIGSFSQYPLRLAWAITIHKSQGLTFEKAAIDLGRAFAPGQAYVALSRLRSLEGLYLKQALRNEALQVDGASRFFMEEGAGKDLEKEYQIARQNYLWQYLAEVFDWSAWFQEFEHEFKKRYEKLHLKEEHLKNLFIAFQSSAGYELELAQKFRRQLAGLIQAKKWSELEERLNKATAYFEPKLKNQLQLIAQLNQEYRNLKRTKAICDWLEVTFSEGLDQYVKLKSVLAYWNFFRAIDPKLKFDHEQTKLKLIEEIKAALPEPKLKAKASKPKLKKGETYQITYQMLKDGLRPAEVARERKLSLSTIYGHCLRGIQEEEISPEQVLSSKQVKAMNKLYLKGEEKDLKSLWRQFPDHTYQEWQVFLKLRELVP